MGVSVYYTCMRDHNLTDSEEQEITAIIDKYNEGFELKDMGETFYVYDYDQDKPTVIFAGSTKLPFSDNFEDTWHALFYWLNCLTDVRRSISNGDWHVHLDDTDAIWDEEAGWQMPQD
ncbi:hypothetical protein OMP38_33360 [Cohnella ginsengisoli]|uniref:Uncharacterized protein n=1 Tax=Cohnella ginsengisoli TaxID=425004 RepID=A0A9X4QR23_9BACL|nr:hypothetical protein [Cohnella ginsengisoli]MDG0795172.1 hypothetical protein [Cohnella ginsengisoli]